MKKQDNMITAQRDLRRAWRVFSGRLVQTLRLDRLVDWLAIRLPAKRVEPMPICKARGCKAIQYSDQMVCSWCNLRWDTNDAYPPNCGSDSWISVSPDRTYGVGGSGGGLDIEIKTGGGAGVDGVSASGGSGGGGTA